MNSKRIMVLAVLLATGIRLVFAPLFGGFQYDMYALADWSWHLQFTPMNRFYEFASNPDHLPGDLWFLWWLGTIFRAFGGMNFESDSYQFAIKTVPALADAAIGILVFAIVSTLRAQRDALRAALFYLFNPAVIYLTSVWGQWDSVSMALVVFALWIVLTRQQWLWAVPLVAWAMVIKPPLVPLCGLVVLIPVWRDYLAGRTFWKWIARTVMFGCASALIAFVSILAVILPFGVGLPGLKTTWQLLDRMQVAIDLYPQKTLAAANFWMLGQGSLARISDEATLFAGLNSHQVGNLLLVVAMLVLVATIAVIILLQTTVSIPVVTSWMMLLASFSFFMLPTRVHERYLFPALVCLALLIGLTGMHRAVVVIAAGTTVTYLANLAIVYGGFRESLPVAVGDFTYGTGLIVLAIANIVLFGGVIWGTAMWISGSGSYAEPIDQPLAI